SVSLKTNPRVRLFVLNIRASDEIEQENRRRVYSTRPVEVALRALTEREAAPSRVDPADSGRVFDRTYGEDRAGIQRRARRLSKSGKGLLKRVNDRGKKGFRLVYARWDGGVIGLVAAQSSGEWP